MDLGPVGWPLGKRVAGGVDPDLVAPLLQRLGQAQQRHAHAAHHGPVDLGKQGDPHAAKATATCAQATRPDGRDSATGVTLLDSAMRIREPFNGASHLVGLLLAGGRHRCCCSAWRSGPWQLAAFSIYGATLILLYGSQHPLPLRCHCPNAPLRALRTLDHIAIYFLIAGTYTPVALHHAA